jgi:hypothetical protein
MIIRERVPGILQHRRQLRRPVYSAIFQQLL